MRVTGVLLLRLLEDFADDGLLILGVLFSFTDIRADALVGDDTVLRIGVIDDPSIPLSPSFATDVGCGVFPDTTVPSANVRAKLWCSSCLACARLARDKTCKLQP